MKKILSICYKQLHDFHTDKVQDNQSVLDEWTDIGSNRSNLV